MSALTEILGNELVISHCVFGMNLNLRVVRGFARLDLLADISGADVFDQELNPLGTQRDLKTQHAKEATTYAFEALTENPAESPKAFPEIILNARDANLVSVLNLSGDEFDADALQGPDLNNTYCNIKIDVSALGYPQPKKDPQISRLDGNHRLSQIPEPGSREGIEFPVVPFALFVGLSADQERALFRDINGNQRKMEVAHLDAIKHRLGKDNLLLQPNERALWLAYELNKPGKIFENMVFLGGATAGIRKAHGQIPPLRISSLKTGIGHTLQNAPSFTAKCFPTQLVAEAELGGIDSPKFGELESNAKFASLLLDRYWRAVKKAYPTAWQDKQNYVLLQSVGFGALSKFAGVVIEDLVENSKVEQADFDSVLKKISMVVTLEKSQYEGIAGLAGVQKVYTELLEAQDDSGANWQVLVAEQIGDKKPSPLDTNDQII